MAHCCFVESVLVSSSEYHVISILELKLLTLYYLVNFLYVCLERVSECSCNVIIFVFFCKCDYVTLVNTIVKTLEVIADRARYMLLILFSVLYARFWLACVDRFDERLCIHDERYSHRPIVIFKG